MKRSGRFLTGMIAFLVAGVCVLAWSKSSRLQAATPIQWEYTIVNLTDDVFLREMNRHGAAGWELAYARRGKGGGMAGVSYYEVILKRPKQ